MTFGNLLRVVPEGLWWVVVVRIAVVAVMVAIIIRLIQSRRR